VVARSCQRHVGGYFCGVRRPARQQRRLAAAPRVDFAKDGKSALWPALLSRKILANAVPGQTPQKRKAPDSRLDVQIKKPGAAPPPQDGGASKRPRRDPAGKGVRDTVAASDASKSDSDASLSAADEPLVVSDDNPVAPAALMPSELGTGTAFADLVRMVCARSWVAPSCFESGLSAVQSRTLWRARLWSGKDRTAYEKMIIKQASRKNRSSRREDPNLVACPHRPTFAWSGDSCVDLEAKHLAMVCTCENLSDWAGQSGRSLGGSAGRAAYAHVQSELHDAWSALTAQVARNEHVGALSITAVTVPSSTWWRSSSNGGTNATPRSCPPAASARKCWPMSLASMTSCMSTLTRSTIPWRTGADARIMPTRPATRAIATSPSWARPWPLSSTGTTELARHSPAPRPAVEPLRLTRPRRAARS
jgi:hypothetical protein